MLALLGTPGIHVAPGFASERLIEGYRRFKIEHDNGAAEQENGVGGDNR